MSNDGAYGPLKEWEFRVLILKDDGKDGFICGLKTLSIDTNLGYVALSYTWGDATDTGSVRTCECCQRRVTTRQNLINALRQLHKLGYRHVWADALCINQNDLAERASQVKMMRHIYEKAQRVFIWLSPVSECTSVPKPVLNLLCTLDTTPSNMAKAASAVEKDPTSVAFLADILKCDYWRRAWIIQEIAVGLRVGMLLADHIVPWENLVLLIHPAVAPVTDPTVAPISRLALKLPDDPDVERGFIRLLRLHKTAIERERVSSPY